MTFTTQSTGLYLSSYYPWNIQNLRLRCAQKVVQGNFDCALIFCKNILGRHLPGLLLRLIIFPSVGRFYSPSSTFP